MFNLINNKQIYKERKKWIIADQGLYKLNCSDCKSYNIGKTGRSLQYLVKDHFQALKSNNRTMIKSNFAEDLPRKDHTYKWKILKS